MADCDMSILSVSIAFTILPDPLFNSLHGYISEIAFKVESLHWWSTWYIWLNSDVVDVRIASSNNAVEGVLQLSES